MKNEQMLAKQFSNLENRVFAVLRSIKNLTFFFPKTLFDTEIIVFIK